jgi:hypothetical protein
MPSEIEVKVVRETILEMTCTEEAFARLRQLLIAEIPAGDPTEGKSELIRGFMIGPKPVPITVPPTTSRELVALFGCTSVVLAIVALVVIGFCTVAGWLQ